MLDKAGFVWGQSELAVSVPDVLKALSYNLSCNCTKISVQSITLKAYDILLSNLMVPCVCGPIIRLDISSRCVLCALSFQGCLLECCVSELNILSDMSRLACFMWCSGHYVCSVISVGIMFVV